MVNAYKGRYTNRLMDPNHGDFFRFFCRTKIPPRRYTSASPFGTTHKIERSEVGVAQEIRGEDGMT